MGSEGHSGVRIVSIGGGTGLATLLSGLKRYVGKDHTAPSGAFESGIESLTAVVTVSDDGGSSGRLREEFQMLPPGDIRNCMVALAEDERLLTKLFQYRFQSGGELSGHSFGNLFLTALQSVTGDFLEAIRVSSEVLAIKGRIFPATMEDVDLLAELEDGRVIRGESKITGARSKVNKLWLSRTLCKPLPETLEALHQADLITIGPGSLYTSIIPNLLVDGITEAIRRSPALKVYICNIMTQPGETAGFHVEDHLRTLLAYSSQLTLDCALVNATPIGDSLREKYLADGAVPVEFEAGESFAANEQPRFVAAGAAPPIRIVCGDLLNENGVVRHDPRKLAELLLRVYHAYAHAERFTVSHP